MGGSIFVLLVDDDAAFADAAARSFESVGMRAVVALGPNGALDVFDDAIDVVVTDIKLPAALETTILPTRGPLASGAISGSLRSTLVWSLPPSPFGTLT